jgi:hypothetical protein
MVESVLRHRRAAGGTKAEKWLKDQGYLNQSVHSIEVTPAMKKAVMKTGQPIAKNTPPTFDWQKAVLDGSQSA